ncbi:PREDICTED: putative protein TPRXL [Eufriesea mexicana]|uniref:putative protein TPRXL n=1 Tax=Eufriesea mexicana TaxID=516756 RepID=UPI00083BD460|nr:PREDICTED: putative protein TPRXL [Eufriesea mexicana]
MENTSDAFKEQETSSDNISHVGKSKENSLRLRLVRVFSSGTLKTPKCSSPLSVSSSPSSSPGYCSSCVKGRYSWHLSSSNKDHHSPCSVESGVSLSSSKSTINTSSANSPTTSFSPPTPYSTWYINERHILRNLKAETE